MSHRINYPKFSNNTYTQNINLRLILIYSCIECLRVILSVNNTDVSVLSFSSQRHFLVILFTFKTCFSVKTLYWKISY